MLYNFHAGTVFVLLFLFGAIVPVASAPSGSTELQSAAIVRASLVDRSLWGRDYGTLLASIPGWARVGERRIIIAPNMIFGETSFRTKEEAASRAKELSAALMQGTSQFPPELKALMEGGPKAADKGVEVRPYQGGESYRVVVGYGRNPLAETLNIESVRQALGEPQDIKRSVDTGGERRPLETTTYVYAGGAAAFVTSNYGATNDQVVQVILDVPAAVQAIGGTP